MSHPLLTHVDDDRLRRELWESRKEIERRFGSCTSVAYPFGVADERVAAAAQDGYEVACMLTFAHFVDKPFRRPRIGFDVGGHSPAAGGPGVGFGRDPSQRDRPYRASAPPSATVAFPQRLSG